MSRKETSDGGNRSESEAPGKQPEESEAVPETTSGGREEGAASRAEAEGQHDESEATIADLRDRLARARADYTNLQKRVERDATLERDRVKARVLEHFLTVYEYSQMAAMEAERQPGPLAEGVKMIVREFDRMLESEGVTPIGCVGEPFDAALHEAVAEEEPATGIVARDGGEVAPGAVSRVVKPGYRLGERVLRYARVATRPTAEVASNDEVKAAPEGEGEA